MIKKLSELIDLLKTRPAKKVVVACSDDPHTIGAVARAVGTGHMKAVMVGARAAQAPGSPDGQEMKGDYLMKGLIDTAEYMRAILDKEEWLLPPGKTLSHVAVLPNPDLSQKVEMVKYYVETSHCLKKVNRSIRFT